MTVTYKKEIAEFTAAEFENDIITITDNSGSRVQLDIYEEFDRIVEARETYKKMKELET